MLKNRFLSVFALAFAAGISACFLAGSGGKAVSFIWCTLFALVFVICFAVVSVKNRTARQYLVYPLLFAIGLFCGSGYLLLRSIPYDQMGSFVGTTDTVVGTVVDSGSSAQSGRLILRVERSRNDLPSGTCISLYSAEREEAHIGDSVTVFLTYSALSEDASRAEGVSLVANAKRLTVTQQTGIIASMRNAVLQTCEELYTPYDASGITQALTVRERSQVDASLAEAYRNAGLAHLLAISGLHLTILIFALRKLLLLICVPRRVGDVLSLLLLLLYCMLTGFSPSIVRASVMLAFLLIGSLTLYRIDSMTTLFAALLLLLLWNPYALLSVSLQLSFLSCFGILAFGQRVSDLERRIAGPARGKHHALRSFLGTLASTALVSCIAIVFTFPVTVFRFGTVSWIAPLTNLLVLPLFTPLLALVFLSVPAGLLWLPIGRVVAFLPGQALRLLHGFLEVLQDAGIGSADVSPSYLWLPMLLSVLSIVAILLLQKHKTPIFSGLMGAFAVSLALCLLFSPGNVLSGDVLFVSEAQRVVFVSCDSGNTLLDLGQTREPIALPETLTDGEVDSYIVSSVSDASYARFAQALDTYRIEKIYLPMQDSDGHGNDLSDWEVLAGRSGCRVEFFHQTVKTDALLYSAQEGRAYSVFGGYVYFYGKHPLPDAGTAVLLPGYWGCSGSGDVHGEVFASTNWDGIGDKASYRMFTEQLLLTNGKEVTP